MGRAGKPRARQVPDEAQRTASLSDADALELARSALAIEEHYSRRAGHPVPMDIEWAKDADDGRLYIVQARPETVHRAERRAVIEVFSLPPDAARERLVTGVAIGQRIGVGRRGCLANPRDLDLPGRRGARGGHDRSRLGADHEARRGDRDRPRRPHLPRRDREPRARRALRRRHRQRHARCCATARS